MMNIDDNQKNGQFPLSFPKWESGEAALFLKKYKL